MGELLPQLLGAADVVWLPAFVAASQEDHDPLTVKSVVNAQTWADINAQLKYPATHRPEVAEVTGAHAGQTGIYRCLLSSVSEGIEPLVKRDESVLKLKLPDLPLNHRRSVIYR